MSSFPARIARLAKDRGDDHAIVLHKRSGEVVQLSWVELDQRSSTLAHRFHQHGVGLRSRVLIKLPNSLEHYVAALASWKVGACAVPMSSAAPESEERRLLDVVEPDLVVSHVALPSEARRSTLPDVVAAPGVGIPTGGSTGLPKILITQSRWERVPGTLNELEHRVGMRPDQRQLVAGPLYHGAPLVWGWNGLFEGHTLHVMERFDAERAAELLRREAIQFAFMVPTMLARVARLPGLRDVIGELPELAAIFHAGAPCPPWVKQAWIDLVGPGRIHEAFGPSEGFMATTISGREWLARKGSVGRPLGCEIEVRDDEGRRLPSGEIGELWGRPLGRDLDFDYLGKEPARRTPDGFATTGDMGWLDGDGYLFIADRRADLILRGGANVYPAEVEAAVSEHPGVLDVAVIGLPDEDLGQRVHAVVQPADAPVPVTAEDLDAFVRTRLAPYKVPQSYEFVEQLPRNDAGKLRRGALVEQRR